MYSGLIHGVHRYLHVCAHAGGDGFTGMCLFLSILLGLARDPGCYGTCRRSLTVVQGVRKPVFTADVLE